MSAQETPVGGWIPELSAAKAGAKTSPKSKAVQLRYAEAAAAVRQWKVCKFISQKGLHLDPSSQRLQELSRQAEQELSVKARNPDILERVKSIGNDIDVSGIYTGNPCFTNFNSLQFAASLGDIVLLETAVAMGAALDYPVLDPDVGANKGLTLFPAPKGATALLMAVAQVAMHEKVKKKFHEQNLQMRQQEDQIMRSADCCVRLIMLGANRNVSLNCGNTHVDDLYKRLGFNGKSVEQLARISGHQGILEALEETADPEASVDIIQCRCGSRLPWKHCHAGAIGESPTFIMRGDERCWRFSPTALCPCKNTTKKHYKCCWVSTRPTYQRDSNGELVSNVVSVITPELAPLAERLKQMKMEGAAPDERVFPRTTESYQRGVIDLLRSPMGSMVLQSMATAFSSKSLVGCWNPEVYAGCIEHQDPDRFFQWTDVHWALDKSELLVRVKEWNDALHAYCDEKGIVGDERIGVMQLHQASPYAPCANPPCDEYEERVKEYQRCCRCKRVAYCSKACQRAHWKEHKPCCVKN